MTGPERAALGEIIDAFGVQAELSGWPRIAGRVLGSLLLADPPELSLGDISEGLGISKGSASTMTRFLLDREFIERVALGADRRAFFRIAPGIWPRLLKSRLRAIEPFHRLAERASTLLSRTNPGAGARIHEMADFYAWWEAEAPGLWQRWEEHQRASQGRKPQ